jgi:hypothetical protein
MGLIILFNPEILDHKSKKATEIYTHVSVENVREIGYPLGGILGRKGRGFWGLMLKPYKPPECSSR